MHPVPGPAESWSRSRAREWPGRPMSTVRSLMQRSLLAGPDLSPASLMPGYHASGQRAPAACHVLETTLALHRLHSRWGAGGWKGKGAFRERRGERDARESPYFEYSNGSLHPYGAGGGQFFETSVRIRSVAQIQLQILIRCQSRIRSEACPSGRLTGGMTANRR